MRALIIPNLQKAEAFDLVLQAIRILTESGIEPLMEDTFSESVAGQPLRRLPQAEAVAAADLIIAIGGDGTILHSAKLAMAADIPVLGINAGRIGFLAGMEANEIPLLAGLTAGEYQLQKRMILRAESEKTVLYAINDMALTRGAFARVVDVEVFCDGELVGSYRGDGVLISTPTGSTAYAMSAGGPVVDPQVRSLALTPICPHSPFSRTILFAPDKTLTLRPREINNPNPLSLSADGAAGILVPTGGEAVVRVAERQLKLLQFGHKSFHSILNKKLMGGNWQ